MKTILPNILIPPPLESKIKFLDLPDLRPGAKKQIFKEIDQYYIFYLPLGQGGGFKKFTISRSITLQTEAN